VRRKEGSYLCAPIKIINSKTLDYIEALADRGYAFTLVETLSDHYSFDLPLVTSSAPAKPRIHPISDSTCVSCEG